MNIKINDRVKTTTETLRRSDDPSRKRPVGSIGTVVHISPQPSKLYFIRFDGDDYDAILMNLAGELEVAK